MWTDNIPPRPKCNSCRKGYNGRNGNGYQPCGCPPKPPAPPPCSGPDGSVLWLLAAAGWLAFVLFY